MITRSHRFHGYGSLNAVYRRGQTVREPSVSLKYLSRRPNKSGRVAIVVSKKVSKSAVVRNRIRRRIYETVRKQETDVTEHFDMVFTVFSDELAHQPQPRLDGTIKSLVQKAVKTTVPTTGSSSPGHGIVNAEGNK